MSADHSTRSPDQARRPACRPEAIPSLMIKRSRALGALVVSTALLVAGCSAAASGSVTTATAPSQLRHQSSAATSSRADNHHRADHGRAAARCGALVARRSPGRRQPAGPAIPAVWSSRTAPTTPSTSTIRPATARSGAIDWAHATSTDLVTWTDQPVAIAGTADEQVLTGSIVVDTDNTSGPRHRPTQPPMVAIYTTGRAPDDGPVPGLQHRSRPDLGEVRRQPGPAVRDPTRRSAIPRSSGTSPAATG